MYREVPVSAIREFGQLLARIAEALRAAVTDPNAGQAHWRALKEMLYAAKEKADELTSLLEPLTHPQTHHRTRGRFMKVVGRIDTLEGRIRELAAICDASRASADSSSGRTFLLAFDMAASIMTDESSRLLRLAADYSRERGDAEGARPSAPSREFVEQLGWEPSEDLRRIEIAKWTETAGPMLKKTVSLQEIEPDSTTPCTLIPVFFATDRAASPESKRRHATFMDRRGDDLTYGIAEVSIPPIPIHKRGRVERPLSFWKFQLREDPARHVVITRCETVDEHDWIQAAAEDVAMTANKAALVFIHGFNVSFDDAIRQAAQIGRDLEFEGLVAAYSWSSCAAIPHYAADEDSVRLTVPRLRDFLGNIREAGVTTIHVIAHSMGNRALLEALEGLPVATQPDIGEVVMAAPDIDADLFKASVSKLKGKARRYTLYGSASDRALALSKKAHAGYVRAGDGGANILVVGGVETVDATAVGEDLFGIGHSYFSTKRPVLSDLYYLIRESLPAARRAGLLERPLGSLKYWLFEPRGLW